MTGSMTERQREILESIRDGSVPEEPPTGYRISARALANRRLVAIYGHGRGVPLPFFSTSGSGG